MKVIFQIFNKKNILTKSKYILTKKKKKKYIFLVIEYKDEIKKVHTLDILLKYTFHPKYKRKRYIYNCVSKILRNNDNNDYNSNNNNTIIAV